MVRITNKLLLASATLMALFVLAACASSTPATTDEPTLAENTAPALETPVAQAAAPEATATTAPEPTSAEANSGALGEVSFSRDVMPILQSRCINCHGGQRTSEGLDLKTYDALMAGSQNGSVVTPGDAANSLLVSLAAQGKMPKRGPKLTPAEIKLLTDWVNAGAPNN